MSKKVISFSLWGNNPTYNIGAIRNAELVSIFYPDFECWFYIHKETVPTETINNLLKLKNVKIIFKIGNLNIIKPMTWRFETIDHPDVEINMSRDTDTRILLREKLAVEEWIKSGKSFHIMRDHPHHSHYILGGMFGIKKNYKIKSWVELINNYCKQNGPRNYDQDFLRDIIYPMIKDDCIIHATFHKHEGVLLCKKFPIEYDKDLKFVGEYVYANESRSQHHINELKKSLS